LLIQNTSHLRNLLKEKKILLIQNTNHLRDLLKEKNDDGDTAACIGHKGILSLLLEKGANIEAKNIKGDIRAVSPLILKQKIIKVILL
jgi:hypothetical protein